MKRIICLLMLLFCVSVAYAAPTPTLTLDFENGVESIGPNGERIRPRVEGKVKTVEGKFGRALISGPSGGYLFFPTKDIISLKGGTVEMWVSPIDWRGTEKKFHTFFEVAGGGGSFLLYKYYKGGLRAYSTYHNGATGMKADKSIDEWKPGEWHHIAMTWSRNYQSLYIDGKIVGDINSPHIVTELDREFMIGDNPWNDAIGKRTSSSLIDRVRIYDEVLSDELIAAHYAGDYKKSIPLSSKTAEVITNYDRGPGLINIDIQTFGVDRPSPLRAEVSIQQYGKTLKRGNTQPLDGTTQFNLNDLSGGLYQIVANITSKNKPVIKLTKLLTVPTREWMGNKLGLEDKVLPPWTPLKVQQDGDKVVVNSWGRSYQFKESPFPSQIVSQGEELLRHPINLFPVINGKILEWSPAQVKVSSATPTKVNLQTISNLRTDKGIATLKVDYHLEFDGIMLMDLSLDKPEGVVFDSMYLEIPVKAEHALYRQRWSPEWTGVSSEVPEGQGVVDHTDFIPYSWLGDNNRGLFWFCESGEFWPNFQSKYAYETRREDGAISMRLNLLDSGQKLPNQWKFQTGLQATPVKSLPSNWRKNRVMHGLGGNPLPTVGGNMTWIWPQPPGVPVDKETVNASKRHMEYFGSPRPVNAERFKRYMQELHETRTVSLDDKYHIFKKFSESKQPNGIRGLMYSWLSSMSNGMPESQWFATEWRTNRVASNVTGSWSDANERMSLSSKSYSDFVVWENIQAMKEYGLDGFYHDDSNPYSCTTDDKGCSWRDSKGKIHPRYPVIAYRDVYKRFYAAAKEVNPDAFLVAHMSGNMWVPILSFEDAYLDGENFKPSLRGAGTEESYTNIAPLDYWRAELMGKQWGVIPFFYNVYGGQRRLKDAPNTNYISLVLLHDILPWAYSSGGDILNETFQALDEFGYIDSKFIPYFDKVPPVTTDMKDVYASVYKKEDRALVLIVNNSFDDKKGTVTLNRKRIGISTEKIISWPDKKEISREGDVLTVDIPKQNFRLLLIGKVPQ